MARFCINCGAQLSEGAAFCVNCGRPVSGPPADPAATYNISGTCVENPHPQDVHDRNMIVKGTNEKEFLISSRTEKRLESRLCWRAVGMTVGGAALSVVCLAVLLAKLGLL